MRGPIDFIIVNFKGNNFNGGVLEELAKVVKDGTIAVLDIALITKDKNGEVAALEMSDMQDAGIADFAKSNQVESGLITADDISEVGDIIADNSSVGLLVIEQLWAKGLKKAIIEADGELIAEGRIHPEAAEEISKKGEK
ncbi:MAG TPA: DUF6325 family protein [Candidatus Saccharibacteria bacterium]|nr:DUF6325 family protein [Candidatus Saccharibacteria bacterium]HMT39623.1 DUF6325 family protein [Candidatus Saccharibacteria bacterium]